MKPIQERQLAALAKRFRKAAGRTRASAAREMQVSQVSLLRAEQNPELSLARLRVRMIERYSKCQVIGPVYLLKKK